MGQVRVCYRELLTMEQIFNLNGYNVLLKIIPNILPNGYLPDVAICYAMMIPTGSLMLMTRIVWSSMSREHMLQSTPTGAMKAFL